MRQSIRIAILISIVSAAAAAASRKAEIPASFDARKQWPRCSSIGTIRDQGSCDSSWALAVAAAITDRICIADEDAGRNAPAGTVIGAEDLLECCTHCWNVGGDGCKGGSTADAWSWWATTGVTTGGHWRSSSGCKPYALVPCNHVPRNGSRITSKPSCGFKHCKKVPVPAPTCVHQCGNGYNVTYEKDKHFGASSYRVNASVEEIQRELIQHGPLTAVMSLYTDLYQYWKGVYEQRGGVRHGYVAVKLIGWGVDNDGHRRLPYWLAALSWNSDWGERGLLRIVRGRDECGIESAVHGGIPKA